MTKLKWTLGFLVIWLALVACGNWGLRRTEEASALACARASDGTDSSIAHCYIERDLPLPEDL